VVHANLTYPFRSSCAHFSSPKRTYKKISAFAEVKIYIRDILGKNTTDVLRTHNMDKTCILPEGILALVIRHAYRILSAAHYTVLSGLSGCTIFYPYYLINGKISGKKNTGRFIMFSVITNIYNKNTKGPALMELFTDTGKRKKFF